MISPKEIALDILGSSDVPFEDDATMIMNGMSSVQIVDFHKRLRDSFPEKQVALRKIPNLTITEIEEILGLR